MKRLTHSIVGMIASIMLFAAGCDNSAIVKDTTPPPNSQVKSQAAAQNAMQAADLIPGQYIVVFKDQAGSVISNRAATQAVQRTQSILVDNSIAEDSLLFQYKYALKGFAAKLSPGQADRLRKDIRVKRVTQARMFHVGIVDPSTTGNGRVSRFSTVAMNSGQITPWGVTRVGGPLDGTGKTVWVIDSGVDLDHPDLNVDVGGSVSFIPNSNADDQNGHGTHVAGIVAAKDNNQDVVGVAAGATVVPVKVCNSSGGCPEPGLLNGIGYVSNHAAPGDIVNISIWNMQGTDLNLDDAVTTAANNGVRLVLIAGNAADDANNYSPGRVNNSNIWTVSAFNQNDDFATSFSNYGNPPIDYSEPGVDILSLWKGGGTNTISGTSMAAPHLAGLLLASSYGVVTNGYVSNDPDGNSDPIGVAGEALPLHVNISGTRRIDPGATGTWSASVSHNEGPVSYQWYIQYPNDSSWYAFGTNSSISTYFQNQTSSPKYAGIKVTVTSAGESDTDQIQVQIYPACNNLVTSGNNSVVVPNNPEPCN